MPLDKDPAILQMLAALHARLGAGAFVLADHWEQDLCAIGIASPVNQQVLVYISSYREPAGEFSYELELPPPPGSDLIYQRAGGGKALSIDALAQIVSQHLSVANRT